MLWQHYEVVYDIVRHANTKIIITRPAYTTCTTKMLMYSFKLSWTEYDDPSNILERVWRAQFSRKMNPGIYQKSYDG